MNLISIKKPSGTRTEGFIDFSQLSLPLSPGSVSAERKLEESADSKLPERLKPLRQLTMAVAPSVDGVVLGFSSSSLFST